MVFQNFALYPHITVRDNMAFGLKIRKYPKAEIFRRVNDASGILGLAELLDRKHKALPGGQRQRVAVGRALVRKPKLFLFDKPLPNLDAKMRVQMRTELTRLYQGLESTKIQVTHDQVEAMTMALRIVVMSHGKIQQVDTTQKLYNEPNSLFVSGFLGSPQMNFIRGTLGGTASSIIFTESRNGQITLNLGSRAGAEPYIGKDVTLGIRPEDCSPREPHASITSVPFLAKVDAVEHTGAETYYYLSTSAHSLVTQDRQAFDNADSPRDICFTIDSSRAPLFDVETSFRIL